MALDQEQRVMSAIGLGAHYNYFNGSGSCEGIRKQAVQKLPEALAGEGLPELPQKLLKLLEEIARYEERETKLSDTWVACSNAIRASIYTSQGDKKAFEEVYGYHESALRDLKQARQDSFYIDSDGIGHRIVFGWTARKLDGK